MLIVIMQWNTIQTESESGEEKKKGKVAEHVRNAIAVSGAGRFFGMIIDFSIPLTALLLVS
jgi:hypothetical protein